MLNKGKTPLVRYAYLHILSTAPTEKGAPMEKLVYHPTYAYTDGSGYCTTFDGIELSLKDLKQRLIDDVLRDEINDDLKLLAFDLVLGGITVHGDIETDTYDVFVKNGPVEYRLCRSREDILDFIHYLEEFRNVDYVID